MNVIMLTAAEADQVRGPSATVESAALVPVALTDGRFILSTAVLDDPAHAAHRDFLAGLPQADLSYIANLIPQDAAT